MDTLEDIEQDYWGDPSYDSHLVVICHQLRKKQLEHFTAEDLRIMIGQNISLEILMPMAIQHLKRNILAEGHLFPGDLLNNVLNSNSNYWKQHKDLHNEIIILYKSNCTAIENQVRDSLSKEIFDEIEKSFKIFGLLLH